MRVHADSVASRSVVQIDTARAWRKVVGRVFGVDAALDSVIVVLHLLLFKGQWFPSGYLNLLLYEIDTGDLFRNGVLYLDTSVHLEEVEIAFLDLRGTRLYRRPRSWRPWWLRRQLRPSLAEVIVYEWGRGFDQLLVATLDGTVAFAEMDDVPLLVGEDLEFDVARVFDVFLDEYFAVPECLFGLAAGEYEFLAEGNVVVAMRRPLPPPPATALIITG